jgi:hypothetical protein
MRTRIAALMLRSVLVCLRLRQPTVRLCCDDGLLRRPRYRGPVRTVDGVRENLPWVDVTPASVDGAILEFVCSSG